MATSTIIIIVIAVLVFWCIGIYNNLVTLRNNRENAFANIDVQLKMRHDIIPQLVATVKGYAQHEAGTLDKVTVARANAMNATSINDKITAENELTRAMLNLHAVAEAYPDLKANQNFLELQAQLEGTENRITVARKGFNDATNAYNVTVRKFPANIVAMIFGFDQKPYYEADESASQAPNVEF